MFMINKDREIYDLCSAILKTKKMIKDLNYPCFKEITTPIKELEEMHDQLKYNLLEQTNNKNVDYNILGGLRLIIKDGKVIIKTSPDRFRKRHLNRL